MITDQPVVNHDDMRKVTDNILRDAGMTISDSGGKVTFAGKEPIRKTVIKAGATTSCVLAANAVADAAIWKERSSEGQDIHIDLRNGWIWQSDASSNLASWQENIYCERLFGSYEGRSCWVAPETDFVPIRTLQKGDILD